MIKEFDVLWNMVQCFQQSKNPLWSKKSIYLNQAEKKITQSDLVLLKCINKLLALLLLKTSLLVILIFYNNKKNNKINYYLSYFLNTY